MSIFTVDEFHQALVEVQARVDTDKQKTWSGICNNITPIIAKNHANVSITTIAHYVKNWVGTLSARWEEFSGNSSYPVSHPGHPGDISMAKFAYTHTNNLWIGEYGAARKRLLAFLVEAAKE